MSTTFDCYLGCTKSFKRLSTHVAQNAVCGAHYTATEHKSALPIPNDIHLSTNVPQRFGARLNVSSRSLHGGLNPTRESAISVDELPVATENHEVSDDFAVDDDNNVVF
jgi:hypothetical protein